MKVLIIALAYLLFFFAVEIAGNRFSLEAEATRPFVHIASGVATSLLPLVISFPEIALLGLAFVFFMNLSKRKNILGSIHSVKRESYGELFFPLGAAATALLFPDRAPYTYAMLTMGLGDGLANVVGRRLSSRTYSVPLSSSRKTYAGSWAFLVVTFVIGAILFPFAGIPLDRALLFAPLAAAVLTLAEAKLGVGIDNLVVPLVAGVLLTVGLRFAG